jgi:hypothetical protein
VTAEEGSTRLYVYGIVRKGRLPQRLMRRGLRVVTSGDVAALVAALDQSLVEATRRNLLAHADVVEDAFAWTTILPMRFGVVADDAAAVREEILEPNRGELERLLDAHESTAELSLKAVYDESAVLSEIVASSPQLARLRERYRAAPTLAVGMELGEAVSAELGSRRDRDARRILDALFPLARDVRTGEVSAEAGVVNLAFLVDRSGVDAFDARVEELSSELSPPIHFKVVGPLPPYSFVQVQPLVSKSWV